MLVSKIVVIIFVKDYVYSGCKNQNKELTVAHCSATIVMLFFALKIRPIT